MTHVGVHLAALTIAALAFSNPDLPRHIVWVALFAFVTNVAALFASCKELQQT